MTIRGLNHITFAVGDIDLAQRFYTQVLGAKLLVSGERTVYMDMAGIWLALNLEPGKIPAPQTYTHLAFTVDQDDLPEYKKRLLDFGAKFRADRPRHPQEGQSLYFHDPDGHLIELHTKTREDRINYYRSTRTDLKFYDGGKENG